MQRTDGMNLADLERLEFEIQSKELEVKRLKIAQEQAAIGVTARSCLRGKPGTSKPSDSGSPDSTGGGDR